MRYLVAVSLLLAPLVASAQAAPVSVPLTIQVPPPPPVTVTVNQQVTANGVTYAVTGTLTLTPVVPSSSITGALPGPSVTDTLTVDHQSSSTFHPNDLVYLEGRQFQNVPGSVYLNLLPVPINSWADSEIQIHLTDGVFPSGTMLTVMRPDQQYQSTLGFKVVP